MNCETTAKALALLLAEVERRRETKDRVLLAIDGMSASGKTTLAEALAEETGAGIIHMDDFFLPPEKRTEYRLSQPGGNVDYERFLQEILPMLPLRCGFHYRRFSCRSMDFDSVRHVADSGLVIVEGAYSTHPVFGRPYDITVCLTLPAEEQERRIRARNGSNQWPNYKDKWIPMENYYLEKFRTREQCDFTLDMADL